MASPDWSKVGSDAVAAAKQVIGAQSAVVIKSTEEQIKAMAAIAASIEQEYMAGRLSEKDYTFLKLSQKNALQGILSAYAAIGIVVAQQAADAAWGVIATALKTAVGIPFA